MTVRSLLPAVLLALVPAVVGLVTPAVPLRLEPIESPLVDDRRGACLNMVDYEFGALLHK